MPVSDYDPVIDAASREWDIDPNWARSIMQGESSGSPVDKNGQPIRSPVGAAGLMQIMPKTAAQLGVQNPDDPVQNIWGGVKYLAQLRDRYNGNIQLATAAYNAGPDRVDAYVNSGQPLPAETTAYVPKVANYYQGFARQSQPAAVPVMQAPAQPQPGQATRIAQPSAFPSNDDFLTTVNGGKPAATVPQSGAAGVPSNDDFLTMVNGGKQAPAMPSPAEQPGVANQNPSFEMQPEAGARAIAGGSSVGSAIVQGAERGFGPVTPANPIGVSPQQEAALRSAGIYGPQPGTGTPVQLFNEALINPLMAAGGLAMRTLGGGVGALQGGVAELGSVAGVPQLGRDLAALPEAFPAGIPEAGAALRGFADNPLVARPMTRPSPLAADVAPGGAVRNPLASETVSPLAPTPIVAPQQTILAAPAELPPGTRVPLLPRINALIAEDNRVAANQPAQIPPVGAVVRDPVTGRAEPVVQPPNPLSSGAATIPPAVNPLSVAHSAPESVPPPPAAAGPQTAIPTGLTPAQIEEFRNIPEALPAQTAPIRTQADAEARADQIVNHFASIGNREPIPGAVGSLPTITGNAGLATLYRAVRDSDTPVPFTTLEQAGKQQAAATVSALVKDPSDLADAIAERGEEGTANRSTVFAGKQPGTVAPAVSEIDKIMASPARFNPVVQTELPKFRAMLTGEDGKTPVTDAEDMYGIDKAMRYKISSLAAGTKDDARAAKPQILQVLNALRPQIESAAPGFDNYMSKFSDQSRAIDEMTYLQGRNLVDPDNAQNPISLQKVKSTLADIAKQQRSPRITTADSVTPETIAGLQAVRDQLQREADTQSLGKALGSNTFQNAATSGAVGRFAGHASNALVSGGIGAGIGYLSGEGGVLGGTAGMALGAAAKTLAESRAAKAAAAQEAGRAMLMKALRDRMLNIDNKGVNALGSSVLRTGAGLSDAEAQSTLNRMGIGQSE